MKSLTPQQLEFLGHYGFDLHRFESWQAAVRGGELSIAHNHVHGEILAPAPGTIQDLPRRGTAEAQDLEALGRAAIRNGELGLVILNGGMATRFGGVVKGIVEVLGSRTFLGLRFEDVLHAEREYGGRVAVFLMNSFATDKATRDHLLDREYFGLQPDQVECFTQFIAVRMEPGGDLFLTAEGDISPYGPGHGDCLPALRHHGCLQRFLESGGKHLFVSNVDNLGARIDPLILGHHIQSEAQATVELVPKWPGDVGGAPYVLDGRLQLIEQVRFPDGFDPDIVDVFNTNTFHFRADALDRDFDLGWYYVKKKVEGRDAVQIERLIGEVTRFLSSNFVRVKRTGAKTRFFPIKQPDDLESGREEIAEIYDHP